MISVDFFFQDLVHSLEKQQSTLHREPTVDTTVAWDLGKSYEARNTSPFNHSLMTLSLHGKEQH